MTALFEDHVDDGSVRRPLSGVRVLSFADLYPGPFATTILSDLGAEVIQVERVGGSVMRAFPGLFLGLNRGARAVGLDLKDPRAVQACLDVADHVDVVIEGFRPGVMDRLGLGPTAFHRANPGISYVSISGFGQSGEWASRPGHDIIYQAAAGTLAPDAQSGDALPHLALADQVAGLYAVIAALAGVVSTERGDRGRHHDVAMTDSLIGLIGPQIVQSLASASTSRYDPGDGRLSKDPGYGVYPTSDGGRIAVGIAYEDDFWDELVTIMQIDERGRKHRERVQDHDRLERLILDRFRSKATEEWSDLLQSGDVPFAIVNEMADLADSDYVNARELVLRLPGESRQPSLARQPIVVDGVALGPTATADVLGGATSDFLALAGLTEDEIATMIADGVVAVSDPSI